MDTLIWLANFPASNGFAIVFIAGFSLFGLLAMSAGGGTGSKLEKVRQQQGLAEARRGKGLGSSLVAARRWLARVLALVMAGSLVLGILGLTRVPVTRSYIYHHGVQARATLEDSDAGDGVVVFTASNGLTYHLFSDFFTPSSYPGTASFISSGSQFTVRYLPSHPQAFVIDSDMVPD